MQPRVAAVLAHYDPDGRVDPSFCEVVSAFADVTQRVVIVSTSKISAQGPLRDPRVTIIERPNVGYDFYSYRVGLEALGDVSAMDAVFFANSSFLIVKPQAFKAALRQMLSEGTAGALVGATESLRHQRHLQSYLFLAPAAVLRSQWFRPWFGAVSPKDTKDEVIKEYELGLSAEAHRSGAGIAPLLRLSAREKRKMWLSSLRAKLRTHGILGAAKHLFSLRWLSGNPAHFAALPLAERLGLIKAELLRDNPHALDLSWLQAVAAPESLRQVEAFVERFSARLGASGSPAGLPRIRAVSFPASLLPQPSTAVVVHAYYVDPLPELRRHLLHFTEPFDLFVTTPNESDVPLILDSLRGCAANLTIAICENRGRDVGPFLSLLREGFLDRYQAVLKLHLKKSLYSEAGDAWRRSLFSELCGDASAINRAISLLHRGDIGLVGPHQYFLTNPRFWGSNRANVRGMLRAVGALPSGAEPDMAFFAGSMFWFSPRALVGLCRLPAELLDFPAETGLQDGTTAHAVERMFALLARHAGFKVTTAQLAGEDVFELNCSRNGVPVL